MTTGNGDEFTARMFDAINGMLLDMLAAAARKDYEDRRRRQAQGTARAKWMTAGDLGTSYGGVNFFQRTCSRPHAQCSVARLEHGHFATKPPLQQVIARSHGLAFRRERIVRERPSFIDTKGRAFGLRD
jgi:hypothetical protein